MRKAVCIAAITLAGVVGTKASADVCEFLSPADMGLRAERSGATEHQNSDS